MVGLDCAILGAGPAGLSASLVLGRARRNVALLDNGTNRNRVTQASHGFITRDGIKPADFKKIALDELTKYPSVMFYEKTVTQIKKQAGNEWFQIITSDEAVFYAEKIILATGVQEVYSSVPDMQRYYGKSIFSCPYCDGWELRDQPLIILIEDEESAYYMAKLVYNWSRDLVVATNGYSVSPAMRTELERRNIAVVTEPVKQLYGDDGYLHKVEFVSGLTIKRTGGFITPGFYRPNQFAEQLGCMLQENGAIATDESGRTSQKNIYAAGEYAQSGPSSLMIAAADGSKAAFAVNADMTNERL